jgi:dienelactone hydrolase
VLKFDYTLPENYCIFTLRKLAGKVAASGFCVVVPDFFYGDPFVYDNNRPLAVWLEDHGTVRSCFFMDSWILFFN